LKIDPTDLARDMRTKDREEREVKANMLPKGGGIILRHLTENSITTLQNLSIQPTRSSSVRRVRKLREKIDQQVRG
jgi:hypothetical protein